MLYRVMDRRLAIDLLPGAAFLIAHMLGGLFWAAGALVVATAVAVVLRWRWDNSLPWLALMTLLLALALTVIGVVLRDETFVLIRPTIGSLFFAVVLAIGAFLRPSLLQRALGYKLDIWDEGWLFLHLGWIGVMLFGAAANEVARRVFSTDTWVIFNAASDPVLFGMVYAVTYAVAWYYWREDDEDPESA
ncbi:MAG: septation protein IspZ [Rhodobacteraceae bacterium]|nr:septation protein IspZ [Paracoccaceae bacterium]